MARVYNGVSVLEVLLLTINYQVSNKTTNDERIEQGYCL